MAIFFSKNPESYNESSTLKRQTASPDCVILMSHRKSAVGPLITVTLWLALLPHKKVRGLTSLMAPYFVEFAVASPTPKDACMLSFRDTTVVALEQDPGLRTGGTAA